MSLLDILFHLFEIFAAIAGTVYISKYRGDKATRYFVYFLWVTVFVESVGTIPRFINKFEFLFLLKGTFLEKNAWLFNLYTIFSYYIYFVFFKMNIKKKFTRELVNIASLLFVLANVLNLIFSDVFFETHSSVTMISGTILLLIIIALYFFQILQSDEILNFGKSIVFYIAVGALIMHLCITPLFIYSRFFSMEKSPTFVKVYTLIIPIAIIFTYTCYTIGFVVCLRQKRLYLKNKSYS